jgi:hypothetical protein
LYLLKLRGRGDNPLHLYDLYQNFEDLVDSVIGTEYEESMRELVRKLIAYNFYTTGFGFSPFTLDEALSPKFMNKIFSEIGFYKIDVTQNALKEFILWFAAANPLLFTNQKGFSNNVKNIYKNVVYKPGSSFISIEGMSFSLVGNSYCKNYLARIIPS